MNGCCSVVSQGSGWGCVSEYGQDIMTVCSNATLPANMTGVSNVDKKCR